jgi:hypothetical protein
LLRTDRRSELALSGELGVPQAGRRREIRVDFGTVLPDEPVHSACGSRWLAQRFHLICLLLLAGLSQFPLGLVACLRELLGREGIQPICDLVHPHPTDSCL